MIRQPWFACSSSPRHFRAIFVNNNQISDILEGTDKQSGYHAQLSCVHPVSIMKQCIEICRACERTCLETICYCLSKGGKLADPAHILTLQSCADMCATCSRSMISGSKMHSKLCSTCSEICAACARDCMTLQEDAQTSKCVESCQQCAESCGKMGA